ncbi:MAG: hypothetical protein WC833_08805 [Bacteroidales bacterium]|jgi:hypothetical protein
MSFDYLNGSICLDDIPPAAVKQDQETKKRYLAFTASRMKQPDKYGNTHTIYVRQSKEEKERKVEKRYLGKALEFSFKDKSPGPQTVDGMPAADGTDDLPY